MEMVSPMTMAINMMMDKSTKMEPTMTTNTLITATKKTTRMPEDDGKKNNSFRKMAVNIANHGIGTFGVGNRHVAVIVFDTVVVRAAWAFAPVRTLNSEESGTSGTVFLLLFNLIFDTHHTHWVSFTFYSLSSSIVVSLMVFVTP